MQPTIGSSIAEMPTSLNRIVIRVFLVLAACVFGSEFYYSRRIVPEEVVDVPTFIERFGEPCDILSVRRDRRDFYEFVGHWPSGFVAALPSSPPAYVFDEQGRLVDWCPDPGDQPEHRRRWPLQSATSLNLVSVREKIAASRANDASRAEP